VEGSRDGPPVQTEQRHRGNNTIRTVRGYPKHRVVTSQLWG